MNPNERNYIRSDRVALLINNKSSMYDACLRNGFLLPPKKDAMVTFEFLDQVRSQDIWLPKADDCRCYTCVTPPTKLQLADIVSRLLQAKANTDKSIPRWQKEPIRNLATRILNSPPQKEFQLFLIKHLCPDHEIFHKSYVRPVPKKDDEEKKDEDLLYFQIEDKNNFFDDLPECKSTKRKKIPGLTREMKLKRKQAILAAAQSHVNRRLAQETTKQSKRDRSE